MAGRKSQLNTDEILDLLLSGNTSELDISSGDEDDDENQAILLPENTADESSSSENDSSDEENSTNTRRVFWKKTDTFRGLETPDVPDSFAEENDEKPIMDYFWQYFDSDFLNKIVECTNMRYLEVTGKSFNFTGEELKVFLGVTMLMSCLQYPRIRMYWAKATRVPSIADKITRDRYFTIRSNFKVIDDNTVSEGERKMDKLWKVRPMLQKVKEACLTLPRSPEVAVDEQIIPFSGVCGVKQFVRGKPNPEGLKNFVLANPSGLVLDFEIYQGKGTFPETSGKELGLGVGGSAVLKLCESLPAGTHLFFDRYFTFIQLLETLAQKSLHSTGTIMKSRIPRAVHLTADKILAKQGRGAVDQTVRQDKLIAINKWYDQKPVLIASTKLGKEPLEMCQRWSKKEKVHISVPRPAVIGSYNKSMGGIDFIDRIMSFYRISARTKKWTVRTIFHFFDLAVANSWVQYRNDKKKNMEPRKNILQYLDFKMRVSEYLLSNQEEVVSDEDWEQELTPSRKRLSTSPFLRKKVAHLPEMTTVQNSMRCKNTGCTKKTKVKCKKCDKFLCLTAQNNCFAEYHEKL